MKTMMPSFVERSCRHLAALVRVAALVLGVGLALPAWSALTVNAGNGTVTDSTTGLVWEQCAQGLSGASCTTGTATAFTWATALTAAASANTAVYKGFSDWRLPNKNELESIVKIDSYSPAIDSTAFPATPNNYFWTSTTYTPDPSGAWFVGFFNGNTTPLNKAIPYYVRLVRSGQSLASFDILATAPATPAAPTATAGNTTASITFVAPADNGSAITGYTATSSPGGFTSSGCTSSPCAVTGLTNGTAYTFTVTATNGVGSSSASAASNSVTPGAPATPAAPTASAGNTTASVTFVVPADNGSAITGYTVISSPAGGTDSNAGTIGLTHTITGLTNGTAYTFTVTATNGAGTSAASAPSNSVTPTAPVVVPPDPTPAIPLLPVSINGIGFGTLPSIVNMGAGDGPTFMGQLVVLLSNTLAMPLHFVEQNTTGTVSLSGYNAGNLSFVPHSFQSGDVRGNGIYAVGNGQYQAVINGQSVTIAPALIHLDQLMALFPGMIATMAGTGTITANLNGTIYAVQPSVAVRLDAATGQASLVLGADGLYRFTDAQGNIQVLYPAFAAPALLRNVLQTIDPAATMNIELDATASVVLGGVRYTLVPDLTLGGIPVEQVGQNYWPDGSIRYRMWVTIGLSQGAPVKPK